jgi:hypothetical protein
MNLPANPAAWPARWKELWEERSGIIEYEANVSRFTAETRAQIDIRRLAAAEKREERTA